jgi:hypothetical protein
MRFRAVSLIAIALSLCAPVAPAQAGCFSDVMSALFRFNRGTASELRQQLTEKVEVYLSALDRVDPETQSATEIQKSLRQAAKEILSIQKLRARQEGKYSVIPMQDKYIGETAGAEEFQEARLKTGKMVRYFKPEDRDRYRLTLDSKGRFVDAKGRIAQGRYIFVMDQDGNVFGLNPVEHAYYRVHHSSFFDGLPVASAGELQIVKGRIVSMNNRSGHYLPSMEINHQFIEMLQSHKISTSGIKLVDWRLTD